MIISTVKLIKMKHQVIKVRTSDALVVQVIQVRVHLDAAYERRTSRLPVTRRGLWSGKREWKST